jgi:hypothetical protein
MATVTALIQRGSNQIAEPGRNELGPDHSHRGSLGIFTKIDFENCRVAERQHILNFPRLQHLHEGEGSP